MHQRGARRGGRQRKRRRTVRKADKNLEVSEAGRAKKLGRISVSFVSTLFENLISEEICGRFGSFDGSTSVYRALRPRPMIECQLHCLDGFRYFVAEAQQTENGLHLSVMDAGRCAEVRRQG